MSRRRLPLRLLCAQTATRKHNTDHENQQLQHRSCIQLCVHHPSELMALGNRKAVQQMSFAPAKRPVYRVDISLLWRYAEANNKHFAPLGRKRAHRSRCTRQICVILTVIYLTRWTNHVANAIQNCVRPITKRSGCEITSNRPPNTVARCGRPRVRKS